MNQKEISSLLSLGELHLVGSVKHKRSPRDLDIILVLHDDVFEQEFGMSAERWAEESTLGNWSPEHYRWSDVCIEVSRELESRMEVDDHFIDFKIYPKSRFRRK